MPRDYYCLTALRYEHRFIKDPLGTSILAGFDFVCIPNELLYTLYGVSIRLIPSTSGILARSITTFRVCPAASSSWWYKVCVPFPFGFFMSHGTLLPPLKMNKSEVLSISRSRVGRKMHLNPTADKCSPHTRG